MSTSIRSGTSVGSLGADPDPTFGFDPDPTFYLDPDPNFHLDPDPTFLLDPDLGGSRSSPGAQASAKIGHGCPQKKSIQGLKNDKYRTCLFYGTGTQ